MNDETIFHITFSTMALNDSLRVTIYQASFHRSLYDNPGRGIGRLIRAFYMITAMNVLHLRQYVFEQSFELVYRYFP